MTLISTFRLSAPVPSRQGKWKGIDTYLAPTAVRLQARVSTSGLSLTIIPIGQMGILSHNR